VQVGGDGSHGTGVAGDLFACVHAVYVSVLFSSARVVRVCHVSECVGACVHTHTLISRVGPDRASQIISSISLLVTSMGMLALHSF
jgi:hypothetical protein